ncbi:hypothetical protein A6K26_009165 [Gammaproteobacteria bacterium 2W06]|nr:hypothetical protein A6K26_009165 [Gammaproteobacteria bacterium 2W06]
MQRSLHHDPRTRQTAQSGLQGRVALEAAKGHKTASEIAQEFQVHPKQIIQWKRQLLDNVPELFESTAARSLGTQSPDETTSSIIPSPGEATVA